MRAFIAVDLPEGFREETRALARRLEPLMAGRFVPHGNYHVTLAFLGEIGEAEAASAVAAIESAAMACADPVELRSEGLGHFGRADDATLWLGVAAEAGLIGLADRVHAELDAHGIGYEEKPFRPHVTLARRARIPKGDLPALPFPHAEIAGSVTLYRSILDPAGSEYKALHTVAL